MTLSEAEKKLAVKSLEVLNNILKKNEEILAFLKDSTKQVSERVAYFNTEIKNQVALYKNLQTETTVILNKLLTDVEKNSFKIIIDKLPAAPALPVQAPITESQPKMSKAEIDLKIKNIKQTNEGFNKLYDAISKDKTAYNHNYKIDETELDSDKAKIKPLIALNEAIINALNNNADITKIEDNYKELANGFENGIGLLMQAFILDNKRLEKTVEEYRKILLPVSDFISSKFSDSKINIIVVNKENADTKYDLFKEEIESFFSQFRANTNFIELDKDMSKFVEDVQKELRSKSRSSLDDVVVHLSKNLNSKYFVTVNLTDFAKYGSNETYFGISNSAPSNPSLSFNIKGRHPWDKEFIHALIFHELGHAVGGLADRENNTEGKECRNLQDKKESGTCIMMQIGSGSDKVLVNKWRKSNFCKYCKNEIITNFAKFNGLSVMKEQKQEPKEEPKPEEKSLDEDAKTVVDSIKGLGTADIGVPKLEEQRAEVITNGPLNLNVEFSTKRDDIPLIVSGKCEIVFDLNERKKLETQMGNLDDTVLENINRASGDTVSIFAAIKTNEIYINSLDKKKAFDVSKAESLLKNHLENKELFIKIDDKKINFRLKSVKDLSISVNKDFKGDKDFSTLNTVNRMLVSQRAARLIRKIR